MNQSLWRSALFYRHFYISALSPLGFTQHGKNLNYYDNNELEKKVTPFIIESIEPNSISELVRTSASAWEKGQFKFLSRLNLSQHFFERIIPLAHPRFIMQYRRKKIDEYVADYPCQNSYVNC